MGIFAQHLLSIRMAYVGRLRVHFVIGSAWHIVLHM